MTLAHSAPKNNGANGYQFPGFGAPHFTQVPDIFFDEVAPNLTESELRVALYVMRRTFGWKKDHDRISLKQMVSGITTREGEVLDRGTGMSKAGVCKGVQGLVAKGMIVAERNSSARKGDEPTTYRLRFEGDDTPVSTQQTPPCLPNRHPRVYQTDTQDRALQDTEKQGEMLSKDTNCGQFVDNTGDNSPPVIVPIPQIAAILSDFSKEMQDYDHTASNITQATRLYAQAGCSLDTYFTVLYAARTRTRKATGVGNRMAYFFEVLRQEINGAGKHRDDALPKHIPLPGIVPHRRRCQLS